MSPGRVQNPSPPPGSVTQLQAPPAPRKLHAAGLKAGTKIEVVDENRSITAGAGRFSDDFAPLREHVYKLKL